MIASSDAEAKPLSVAKPPNVDAYLAESDDYLLCLLIGTAGNLSHNKVPLANKTDLSPDPLLASDQSRDRIRDKSMA